MKDQWIANRMEQQPLFSPVEIEAAIKLAKTVDPDEPQEITATGQHIECRQFGPNTYAHFLRGKHFHNCDFSKLLISGTNVSNTIMRNCNLEQCKIVNSNLRCSDFSESKLHLSGCSSSFDSSDFSGTVISNSHLEGCSFSESYFWETRIENSTFLSSELAFSTFLRSRIENVDMSQSNLEYSEFERISFVNVLLPYWGILHITKGFSDILLAPDVWFVTPDGTHRVRKEQYVEELSLLRPYFYYKRDFLALANLYIFEGENALAYDAILHGLEYAISTGGLKLLRGLCRVASLNSFFSKAQMRELYQRIEASLANSDLNPMQYKNYFQELNLARYFLIDCPFDQDSISITVRTSIPSTNYRKLSEVLRTLDTIIAETAPTAISHTEVRHNSPIEIIIQVSGSVLHLITAFAVLDFVFNKSTSYIEKVQNIVLNHKKLQQTQKEQEMLERLEKQVAEMKEAIQKIEGQPALSNAAGDFVDVEEIRHISYVLSAKDLKIDELRTFSAPKPS